MRYLGRISEENVRGYIAAFTSHQTILDRNRMRGHCGSIGKVRSRAFLDGAILIGGIVWLVFLFSLSPPPHDTYKYLDVERDAGFMLREGHFSDLTQDVIGFRAICKNQDAYPILGPAMQKLGVFMDIKHVSTHPPTAFLLVSPVGWMSVDKGARVWAWMMVACIAGSFFCLGCNGLQAVGLSLLCLAWPPVAYCLGQLTAIWLLGVCIAYKYLSKAPAISGAMLGLASATKMAPAIMLLLLLRNRKALVGFALVFVVLLGALLVLSPSVITRYVHVVEHTVPQQSGRPDNGSIIGRAHHSFGRTGLLISVAFLALVFFLNWRSVIGGDVVGWSVLSYLAVACLPILWVYSIVPLLFLGRWALQGGRLPKFFFFTFLVATTVIHIWEMPDVLGGAVIWMGIGLIVSALHGTFRDVVSTSNAENLSTTI